MRCWTDRFRAHGKQSGTSQIEQDAGFIVGVCEPVLIDIKNDDRLRRVFDECAITTFILAKGGLGQFTIGNISQADDENFAVERRDAAGIDLCNESLTIRAHGIQFAPCKVNIGSFEIGRVRREEFADALIIGARQESGNPGTDNLLFRQFEVARADLVAVLDDAVGSNGQKPFADAVIDRPAL